MQASFIQTMKQDIATLALQQAQTMVLCRTDWEGVKLERSIAKTNMFSSFSWSK